MFDIPYRAAPRRGSWFGVVVRFGTLAWLAVGCSPVFACGADSDCVVATGQYRIRMPQHPASMPVGAVIYFHGWQESSVESMQDGELERVTEKLGVALIAPDGMDKTWSFPEAPTHSRDEFAFVEGVLRDAERRFQIDRKQLLATGFSRGGSMVWYLACSKPSAFALFAPVSGAFWLPLPSSCESPQPSILHLHGLSDVMVPLEGRAVANGAIQGAVRASFERAAPRCVLGHVRQFRLGVFDLLCRTDNHCGEANATEELCLHEGGHEFNADWVAHAWNVGRARGWFQ